MGITGSTSHSFRATPHFVVDTGWLYVTVAQLGNF